jgi:hypothetical protein
MPDEITIANLPWRNVVLGSYSNMIYNTKLATDINILEPQHRFFQVGDLVKIVDIDEDPREWAEFAIVQIEHKQCRLRTLDGVNDFWVTDAEICRS